MYDLSRRGWAHGTFCLALPSARELERARELLTDGTIEGFILHTNAVADLGFEAYDRAAEWMAKHGDDEI